MKKYMPDKKIMATLIIIILAIAGGLLFWQYKKGLFNNKTTIRIIGTSDLHGKFLPYNYLLNKEDDTGSVVQLSTAIRKYRNNDTILVDAGDTVQDNSAQLFMDEKVHPMMGCLNKLNYDIWVTGNHEYDYTADKLREVIGQFDNKVLTGNVYDSDGNPLADGYTIMEKDGVRIAFIGMVSPNNAGWSDDVKKSFKVTDPLEETRKIIDNIKGKYDLLIGVYHMGLNNEYGIDNSGVTDICNACPEFDVMVASHEHTLVEGETINGVLVVENMMFAQTMSVIDIDLQEKGGKWIVTSKKSEPVNIGDFEVDQEMAESLQKYDKEAKEDAGQVIGHLNGGALSPESEIRGIPSVLIQDTALTSFINEVQMYYSDAKVSATIMAEADANLMPGDIHKSDVSLIYKYTNNLYKLHMTGKQLKIFMNDGVRYYNTYKEGDLTISFNPQEKLYDLFFFDGVDYEINLSKTPGERIENLKWPDGTPVKDEDEFDIAVSNFAATSKLLMPRVLYPKEDKPLLVEADIHADMGGIRELILDYISNVKNGEINSEFKENWKIVGCDWNEELHKKAAEQVNSGEIELPVDNASGLVDSKSLREEDLK